MNTKHFYQNKAKAVSAFLFAAVMALGLAACSDDNSDNPAPQNELGDEIIGTFYQLYDATGAIDNIVASIALPRDYTRVMEVYLFMADGTGLWNRYFFNDESGEPFADLSGGSGGLGHFSYTLQEGGTVSVTLDNLQSLPNTDAYHPVNRRLILVGGQLTCQSTGDQGLTMEKAEAGILETLADWHTLLHGGDAEENEDYNINDKTFTAQNWRQQQSIYIFDGTGGEKDEKNRTGYTIVNLPWNTNVVSTNLPNGFCDAITPEGGWEMVYNLCGNRSIKGGNFFFLYNKYTGTLRAFYYMPSEFATGNDHLWKVSMTNHMAQRSLRGYALPATVNVKDWKIFGGEGDGTLVDCVTPWVKMKSDDGLIVPNEGWWAFDMDLSLYRPDDEFTDKDNIRLQMCSWNTEHVSLYSQMSATISGTIKEKTGSSPSASSISKGLLTLGQAGMDVASGVAAFYADNPAMGFGALSNLLGRGTSIAGIFGDGPFEAEVSLGMEGEINTDGIIQGSATTVGVASPTIFMNRFNKDTAFGHGVWNIKNSPVVYVMNDVYFHFDSLGDWEDIAPVYFFDPSSIELLLNPDAFKDSEMEWYEVDATCVTDKSLIKLMNGGTKSLTKSWRTAFGLASMELGKSSTDIKRKYFDCDIYSPHVNFGKEEDIWYPIADFLHYADDKGDMIYPTISTHDDFDTFIVYNNIGRGYEDGYIIEPLHYRQVYTWASNQPIDLFAPELMVNVVVHVKMKGIEKPFVYVRNYLPDLKTISLGDFTDHYNNDIKTRKFSSKQEGHHGSYDYQVKRLGGALEAAKTLFNY